MYCHLDYTFINGNILSLIMTFKEEDKMYKSIKVIHIIGVILFFGSILGHTFAGVVSSASDNPQVLNIVRQVVQTETYFLTIPGLVLFSLSGVALFFIRKLPIKKLRWLMVHIVLGTFVILNAIFILLPVGSEILEASQSVINGGSSESLQQLETKEAIFGALNLVACFILVTIAVIKPKLSKK